MFDLTVNCNTSFRLVGDVLLATGFLSYSGPFNQIFRSKLLNDWQDVMKKKQIPFTKNLNITGMLVDNATVRISFVSSDWLSLISIGLQKQYLCFSDIVFPFGFV